MDTWASITREFIYLPSRRRYDRSISATNSDRLASMQASSLGTPACNSLQVEIVPCGTATFYFRAPAFMGGLLCVGRPLLRVLCREGNRTGCLLVTMSG